MSKSCSPSAVWRSTMSPSTGGWCGLRRCWPRPRGPAVTWSGTVGGWTRPTCRWLAGGGIATGQSISSARSSTCSCPRRDANAARRFFERAIHTTTRPVEVVTDRAPTYPMVLEELLPAAWHPTDRYANNRVEADHGRLKARLRPMRGLKQDRCAAVIIAGHAFVQNLRRGRYELAVEEPPSRRLAVAFGELALVI